MDSLEKLTQLCQKISDNGLNGYIVPHADEYMGEYTPDCAERLAWLTGFTGSAGFAAILTDKAVVMSDGRYTIQLAKQVDVTNYQTLNSQEVKLSDWLTDNINDGDAIGYDPKLHTPSEIENLQEAGLNLKSVEENLIDTIWNDQPKPPASNVILFSDETAGRTAAEKISLIAGELKKENQQAFVLTLPDSIAWLLNIRAHDIPHIPVALSYAIIHADEKVEWFINEVRLSGEVKNHLPKSIEIFSPHDLEKKLTALGNQNIALDYKRSSIWFKNITDGAGARVTNLKDPCILHRACKTESEQNGMRNAHVRDGVAMVRFLQWFEGEWPGDDLTELGLEQKLEGFRRLAKEFKEPSFDTIAGYGANGAIVHYRADKDSNKVIKEGSLLLLDSGAQYIDGTTDVTRTVPVGDVPDEMKRHNTLVLKGHIALACAEFDEGTTGEELDKLARSPLQSDGLDYGHGTGHGVGCYLSVHEEAASISPRGKEALREGMIISNEPGYYKEGEYGIRIENLILVQKNEQEKLYFETITLAPISKDLIIVDMLTDEEINWLNRYHERVFKTLSPHLNRNEKRWLKDATSSL